MGRFQLEENQSGFAGEYPDRAALVLQDVPFFKGPWALFGLNTGIHLHIQNFSIFNSIMSQNTFQLKTCLLQHTAGCSVGGKRFCKNPDNIGLSKYMGANLLDCTGGKSFSPFRFCNIVSHFSGSGMNIAASKDTNAADDPILRSDGKGEDLIGVCCQHGRNKFLCISNGIGIWQTIPQVVENIRIVDDGGQLRTVRHSPWPEGA